MVSAVNKLIILNNLIKYILNDIQNIIKPIIELNNMSIASA
jgi:hypothetical protein